KDTVGLTLGLGLIALGSSMKAHESGILAYFTDTTRQYIEAIVDEGRPQTYNVDSHKAVIDYNPESGGRRLRIKLDDKYILQSNTGSFSKLDQLFILRGDNGYVKLEDKAILDREKWQASYERIIENAYNQNLQAVEKAKNDVVYP
ncbi:MAG: hypothetical protein Q7S74_04925, partial [Nanoarchaeota archaeon]|nr:hypothetical protein [Nanoarchaeota archaeon]